MNIAMTIYSAALGGIGAACIEAGMPVIGGALLAVSLAALAVDWV